MFKRTILIVDDQEINRKILGNILKSEYQILNAEDGEAALKCLREQAENISAVLLDIIMPKVDGYEVLRQMRRDKHLSLIPVIVSSQSDKEETEVNALALGAQDFIAKPYKADIIRHRLSNLIRLRESAAVINRVQKDQLTGLYNKEFFISKVEDILRENPDKKYAIFCFGIERFKLVNDTYGMKKGDEVLRYLADVLQEACGSDDVCGRFVADNFFAMMKQKEQYTNEQFLPWMKKIAACPVEMDIKIHCGIYRISNSKLAVETMCDRAQMAADLNRGKYNEYFSCYDESLRQKLLDEQFIISNMQTALEKGQFQVYYQPKYDLNTELVAGAEALVRWNHPQKGFLSPGEFIPVFEKNGFITKLDRFVWERACSDIRNWLDSGYPPVAVSVNVSRADIYNPKLVDLLLDLIAKYKIPIRYLHLEITESAYTDNPEQIIEVVSCLREMGFIVEMDDFGSGYSSLNMLAEMPVDVLKLDMRFIQTEIKASSGRGILSFVISLAKWMSLAVVAEGVETAEQIAVLRSMDCNYVQGFYFAKPMMEPDFVKLLSDSNVTEMICTNRNAAQYVSEKNLDQKSNGRVMLIVDDIEVNRATLASTFAGEYAIVEKENGQEAWDYLKQFSQDVDIVMLDLLMPVMDGFQLLSRIRSDEKMKDLPVIITSQGDEDSEHRALEMQANDFISKPYNMDIIRHRVENVVGSYQMKCIRDGLLTKEELSQTKEESADRKILDMVEALKECFDVVRLVDPTHTIVYEGKNEKSCDLHSCFSIWGKTTRCNNCTSLQAYENCKRVNKLEYSDAGLYFVVSQYVPYGPHGAVIEMVTKLEDEYVDNIFDKQMLYLNLDEINDQLERDDLTGVYNRRHLDIYLNKYIQYARKFNCDLGIAMIDIDRFKQLNDSKGHLIGDEALKIVSKMLEENIALSKGDFVTRFGGDEFIIVCRNITSDIFLQRINAVVQLIRHVETAEGEQVALSVSAGCVNLSEHPQLDGRQLLQIADRRLYTAKEAGRSCVVAED